jgi:hypothetical protein
MIMDEGRIPGSPTLALSSDVCAEERERVGLRAGVRVIRPFHGQTEIISGRLTA